MKNISILLILSLISCEGPVGPAGPQGIQGVAGVAGKEGTAATARYFDYEISFSGSSPGSDNRFEIPNFNFNKEYCLTYIFNENLVKPVPGNVIAKDLSTGLPELVDMEVTYTTGTTGIVFLSDYRYKENGKSKFKFRTVVAPLLSGGRLSANLDYDELKSIFNLPD